MGAYWCASDVSSYDAGPVFTLPESDYTIENPGDNVGAREGVEGVGGIGAGDPTSSTARHGCPSLCVDPRSGFGRRATPS